MVCSSSCSHGAICPCCSLMPHFTSHQTHSLVILPFPPSRGRTTSTARSRRHHRLIRRCTALRLGSANPRIGRSWSFLPLRQKRLLLWIPLPVLAKPSQTPFAIGDHAGGHMVDRHVLLHLFKLLFFCWFDWWFVIHLWSPILSIS